MPLLRTSHLGPSLFVTLAGFVMADSSGSVWSAVGIAVTILTGQLCIGWTNDLIDLESDREHARKNKPLANGTISIKVVVRATGIAMATCILLSLFGPFGLRGGSLHLVAVGCGLAYNFYLKTSVLSPLPYALAFAAFPNAIALSKGHPVSIWLATVGALFGIAAHFANVVKDMEEDRIAGLRGLPQRFGTRASLLVAGTSLLTISAILAMHTHLWLPVPISVIAVLLIFVIPTRYCFPLVMALALTDVIFLVSRVSL